MGKIKGWKKLSNHGGYIGKYKSVDDKLLIVYKRGNVHIINVLSKYPRGKKYTKVDYTYGAGMHTTKAQIMKVAVRYMRSPLDLAGG